MDLLSRLFLLSSVCVLVTYTAPANEEDGSEEVTIELYRVSVDDWNSKGKDIFVKYLIEEANRYCKDDLDSCMFEAFNSNDPFRTSNYEQTEGYPIKMKNFLNVKFALTLPPNINLKSSAPADYLNKEALATIAANTRGKVRDDTGWSIVTVGETDYELPPDNTLNIAISVAGCVILLALVIALVIMQHKCGHHHETKGNDHELIAQQEAGDDKKGGIDGPQSTRATVTTLQTVVTDNENNLPQKKEMAAVEQTGM